MKILCSLVISFLFTVVLGLSAGKAKAEGFIFVTAGGAFTEDADVAFDITGFGTLTLLDLEFEDAVSVEVGGGGWFSVAEFLDLGVQGGIGYYGPTVELPGFADLEFRLIPFTVLGMVRVPLIHSDRLPHGLLQPYVAIGPSLLLSTLEFGDAAAVGFDIGYDFRAGLNVNLTRRLALFVQYRRTEVDSTLTDGSDEVEVDFVTSHVTAGFGIHF